MLKVVAKSSLRIGFPGTSIPCFIRAAPSISLLYSFPFGFFSSCPDSHPIPSLLLLNPCRLQQIAFQLALSPMALLSSSLAGEVGLRLLFSPVGAKVIARIACFGVGVGFPVYSSFKAIEQKNPSEQEHWLLYWAAYGCFNATEIFSDKLLSWLPGYYHVKLAFLMWLQLPLSNGARHIVLNYLRPVLLKYSTVLDRIVDGTRKDISNFFVSNLQEIKLIRALIQKLALAVYQVARDIIRSSRNPGGGVSGSGTGSSGSTESSGS